MYERESLCVAMPQPGMVLHAKDEGFREEVDRLFVPEENAAAARLIELKDKLRRTKTEDFWEAASEGLTALTGAQFAFISKRVLYNDDSVTIELPPMGEKGSCLMGAAFYWRNDEGKPGSLRNIKYHAYDTPCAYMKYDKVFVIGSNLKAFIPNNPNTLPITGEAYIGVPLFADGRAFAHFGVLYSAKGAADRKLSWNYVELLLHSLEDMIVDRLLEGKPFAKPQQPPQPPQPPQPVVPHDAVSASQSLKPYARSLSHELRTPMQGVVGMLDVMYATVQEAAEGLSDPRMRQILQSLRENIEVVQDSSRRAVEAADNVVHAYEMNMGMPETPRPFIENDSAAVSPTALDGSGGEEARPEIVVTGTNVPFNFRGNKRRRESETWTAGNATKIRATARVNWAGGPGANIVEEAAGGYAASDSTLRGSDDGGSGGAYIAQPFSYQGSSFSTPINPLEHPVVPGLRHCNIREVLQYVVNDSLKVGGRPESAIAHETEGGEFIEVRTRSSSGTEMLKSIEWAVDPGVPETMFIDERDLAKVISCILLNAIKFTEEGTITLTARVSPKNRYIVIAVRDTGCGIPPGFMASLFKPFAREDDSLTRQSEGLGLGLLVAKGLARKLGGELVCRASNTTGPYRGSEFELRVPVTPGDICSRPCSPFGRGSSSNRISRGLTPLRRRSEQQQGAPAGAALASASALAPASAAAAAPSSPSLAPAPTPPTPLPPPGLGSGGRRPSARNKAQIDRGLARKYPLTFLVAEDNKINRKLLVSMLRKLGYEDVREAYDGADAVRQMVENRREVAGGAGQGRARGEAPGLVDVVLMDLWMPYMDGYEAAERILSLGHEDGGDGSAGEVNGDAGDRPPPPPPPPPPSLPTPTILAVTADVTEGALEKAARVGMKGFMTKPYKLLDLEHLIVEYCTREGGACGGGRCGNG
ncbi:hypothetical protein BDY21DRAFT_405443 [Lineolata rhizophorae]|uniref:histidine kinase n=1 Tax=Lineolata rhizophorae TaxID=578093 RepID=A0A6A6NLE5_9PEZI|nr:hypothetical protein BDY21DRAFT_405443 [Lineolata rhizophorae]